MNYSSCTYFHSMIPRYFFVSILCFFLVHQNLLIAQTGPGGVGNATGTDGQPENVMWLDAQSLSLSNNAPVTTWTDRSGNNKNATQATAANQPLFKTNYLNGKPAVYFDNSVTGEQDRLDFDGTTLVNTDYTVIVVGARRSLGSKRWLGGQISTDNANLTIGWLDANNYTFDQRGNAVNAAPPSGTTGINNFGIFTHSLESGAPSARRKLFQNGSLLNSNNSNVKLSAYAGASIGRFGSTYYDIDVAEVIFYKSALNQAQRILVENYLSAKYNIPLAANDFYAEASSSGRTYDLAGVGRSGGLSHLEANTSGLVLTPINGTLDADGEFLIAGHGNTPNTTSTNDVGSGVIERWARAWYVDKTGTLDAAITFDFSDAFPGSKYPVDKSGYALLRYSSMSSKYEIVSISEANKSIAGDRITFNVSNTDLVDGIYTLGSINNSTSPVAGLDVRTWYSYQTGNWNDPNSWTLDGSISPLKENPANEVPQPTDRVVITSGKAITMNINTVATNSLEVIGELDLGGTTGHNFNVISGSGKIRISASNFPAGNAADFVAAGTGGTVEMYGSGATIVLPRIYNNLIINLSNSSNTVALANNLTLNGNFTILQGKFQVNNGSTGAANRRTVTVQGNLTVEANGSMSVSTGAIRADGDNVGGTYGDYHQSYHQVIVSGNFVNNGTVRLTNFSIPDYNSYDNTAASLVMTSAKNSTLICNGTTDLYNLIIDKGLDQTYEVALNAADKNRFALFGKNNNAWNNSNPGNPETQKALWIKSGTLRLTGKVFIPSLTEGGNDFQIGANARLLLDGVDVVVHNTANEDSNWSGFSHAQPVNINVDEANQGLYPFGKLQVNNGYFLLGEAVAISFRDEAAGQIEVNGGELSATQIAISNSATTGDYFVAVNGGTLRLTDYKGRARNTYAMLHLDNPNMAFNMSGGTIIIEGVSGYSTNGILIASSADKYNVTGGTVTINYANATAVQISTTAPFANLTIQNTNASLLSELKILGNLTIPASKTLTTNNFNVTIGNNLTVNGTYNTGTNTTTFNSNAHSVLTLNGTKALYNFTVNKDITTQDVEIVGGPLQVTNNLRVEKGILRYNTSTIEARGSVYNAGTIGLPGTTGKLLVNGTTTQTITVADGNLFTNLELNNATGATLAGGNMSVRGTLTLTTGVFNINTLKLTMQGSAATFAGSSFGTTKMIQTAGNASDGGLEMYVDANETILFPLGTNATSTVRYTPVTSAFTGYADDGYVQINVVDQVLATTNQTGGNILSYYWRVRHRDFNTRPNAQHTFTYANFDTHTSNQLVTADGYVPGKVLDDTPYTRSSLAGVINATNLISFNSITLEKANYTAGQSGRFNNTIKIFYSRQTGNWNDRNTWTYSATGAADNSEARVGNGEFPKVGDIAIIKFGDEVDVNIQAFAAEIILDATNGRSKLRFPIAYNGTSGPGIGYTSSFGAIKAISGGATPDFPSMEFFIDSNWNGTLAYTLPNTDYGDFLNFVNSNGEMGEITFNYSGSSAVGTAILPNTITAFPDLRFQVEGDNATTYGQSRVIVLPSADFTVKRRMRTQDGVIVRFSDAANGNAHIKWLSFDNDEPSRIEFPGSGTARTVTIDSLLEFRAAPTHSNNKIFTVNNPAAGTLQHNLIVNGNILINSGILDLYHGDPAANTNVILTLGSTVNSTLTNTGGQVPDLYRIVMNKGNSQTPTFTFNNNFVLNGATNGTPKALELKNGRLVLNDPAININLSTGGSNFTIPGTAALEVTQGTANVSGNNTGIALDGTLRINGGTVNVGTCATATDYNYIEYSTTGTALLSISSGILNVGSQIRRSVNNNAGILKYRQTGGTVTIGTCPDATPVANRGILEVVNTDSEFTHTGGTLTMVRQNSATSATASLWLEPTVYNTTNSNIYLGNTNTPAGQTNLSINSSIPLNQLTINGTNNPVVNTRIRPLVLTGEFNINSGATFHANALQLTLGADFVNNGTFTPGGNTTVFNGSTAQQIRGSVNTTFYNLNKTTTNTLTLTGTNAAVDSTFRLQSGTFNDGGNTLTLRGNMVHDGTHITPALSTGQGILFAATKRQELRRSGIGTSILGKISIDNPSDIIIPQGNDYNFDITNALRLKTGVLDIGGSLLTITETASIIPVNPFGSANMVQTNSSFTDKGLKIKFNAISTPTTLTFPVGQSKYTPVRFDLTSSSAGSLTVRPANERHTSIVEDVDVPEIVDVDNVLQYHWIVRASGISGFTGTATMNYSQNDVRVTAPYSEADYIPARLYNNQVFWDKSLPVDNVDEVANTIMFPFSGVDNNNISGDFTAGVPDAIPNQVPEYETAGSGGTYTAQATWTPLNGSPAVSDGVGPVGAIIYIRTNDLVSFNNNNIRVYETTIEAGGTLEINGTTGHRLGEVEGTGTLRLNSNTSSVVLPAGFYDSFFSCAGGGLEYGGTGSYLIMGEASSLRNLTISGTGIKTMAAKNITVCNDLTLNGSTLLGNASNTLTVQHDMRLSGGSYTHQNGALNISNDLLVSNAASTFNGGTGGNKTINRHLTLSGGAFQVGSGGAVNLARNLNFSGGTFNGGNGSARFVMNGTVPQAITGILTGSNQFQRWEVNNTSGGASSGVTLVGNVDVATELILTRGLVRPGTYQLKLSQAATANKGASNAYVNGPLYKVMANTGSFTFPVGKSGRWGHIGVLNVSSGAQTLTWKAEYFNGNADTQETEVENLTPSNNGGETIATVSQNEYWKISDACRDTSYRIYKRYNQLTLGCQK